MVFYPRLQDIFCKEGELSYRPDFFHSSPHKWPCREMYLHRMGVRQRVYGGWLIIIDNNLNTNVWCLISGDQNDIFYQIFRGVVVVTCLYTQIQVLYFKGYLDLMFSTVYRHSFVDIPAINPCLFSKDLQMVLEVHLFLYVFIFSWSFGGLV